MRRLLAVIAAVGAGIAFFPTGGEAQTDPCVKEPVAGTPSPGPTVPRPSDQLPREPAREKFRESFRENLRAVRRDK